MKKQKNSVSVGKSVKFLLSYIVKCRWMTIACLLCVLIYSVSNITAPYLLKPIINDYIPAGDWDALIRTVILLACVYLAGVLASWVSARLMIRISQRTTHAIRSDLFTKIQSLPVSYLDGGTHGELMSCYTGDIDTISDAVNTAMNNILSGAITFVGVIIMMLRMSPLLTLVSCCFLVVMYFIVKLGGSRSRFYFGRQQKQLGHLNGYIQEMISGQKVIQVTGHEHAAEEGFRQRNEGLADSTNSAQIFSGSVMPALGGTASINTAVSCCIGAVLVILGKMDLGSLVSYSQYLRQAGQPVATISVQFNLIMAATAGTERIMRVLAQPVEDAGGDVTLTKESGGTAQWNSSDGAVPVKGHIVFDKVSFGYTPDRLTLKELSLEAQPGQKVALVGSTGAGKTTVLNLLTKFYPIAGGCITYDGIPLESIRTEDLRRSFSLVLQDTHLFTGSVRDNIRFGRPDATDAEVTAAAKLASADFFISHLPQGYDTVLTADGGNLSAGQRQLIAIARAAIINPPVLLLDEATASVDTWTEHQIEQGLNQLMAGRTVFIIAHRLSTVRNADQIIVLEQGEVLERGTHAELLGHHGRYYELCTGSAELT